MQTFLPYESFAESASELDRARLGKQRVETLQILQALNKSKNQSMEKVAWINHPATRMWNGYEPYLVNYGIAICEEWISRGYNDTCLGKIASLGELFPQSDAPWWIGDERLHVSHRAMLYSKNPEYYAHFASSHELVDEYWWPVPSL